ncbi:hypothetical protein JEP40_17105 [Proteus vulgaris]|uniref:hypothetical protein n=1 Tax=Proteus vulgaris TaxID=585 RepID=UPI0018E48A80|nr:hypothetical protein [Proteus vulgaris]MBI6530824.1 hypothetical protein [Proteus vulgaris]
MKIYDNLCNFIKSNAEKITQTKADPTLTKIKNWLSSIENSNQTYTTAEKNTISILKDIELKKIFSNNIKDNTSLDKQCFESMLKINNMCKNKDIFVIGQYNTLLNKLEKEHIKKTSQESEVSKKETLLEIKEELFNKIKGANEKLKEVIDAHYQCFQEITKEIKDIDGKNIPKKINEYKKYKSELLDKINNHEIKNENLTNLTELRQYIKGLQEYNNNLNKFIEMTNNITYRYEKELDILNDRHFKLSDDKILDILNHHLDKLKEMNLQIN